MSDDNVLSAEATRALGMARVCRAYPGDFHFRTVVMGQPSPEDVVALLEAASSVNLQGICLQPAAAARLLAQLGAQAWAVAPGKGTGQGNEYEVALALSSAQRTLLVRRYPQAHVHRVS